MADGRVQVHRLEVGELTANCYIIFEENKAVVIDPGAEADRILTSIDEAGCKLELVLLTHGHADHIGALGPVKEKTGCQIAIHAADGDMLVNPDQNLSTLLGQPPITEPGADRLLQAGEVLTVGKLKIEVIHTPGHTPGGACFRIGDCLFTGDVLFARSIGRVDLPGGAPADMKRSLTRLKKMSGSLRVYPGHGPATTLEREVAENPYLREGWI